MVAAAVAVVLLPLAAAPASAAPPANDKPGGAVAVDLGQTVRQDTRQATTDAQDKRLNVACGAPKTNASVWYKLRLTSAQNVVLSMKGSDYHGGFLVFQGAPSADSLVACGPQRVGIRAAADRTYLIMVISDTAKQGGQLVLTVKKAPPAPRVRVRVASRGLAYRGGAARVRGTYFCKYGRAESVVVGQLMQRAGRLKIPSGFHTRVRCDGKVHRWSARAVSRTGIYDRGPATVRVRISACNQFHCSRAKAHRHIRLVRARSRGSHGRTTPTTQLVAPRSLVDRGRHWTTR